MKITQADLDKVQRCPVCHIPLVKTESKRFICPIGLDHTKLILLDKPVVEAHKLALKKTLAMTQSSLAHVAVKPRRRSRYTVESMQGLFAKCDGKQPGSLLVRVKRGDYWKVFYVKQVE